MTPTVYVFVSGGVVQAVRSDHPVAVHVVDYDDMDDNETFAHLEGRDARERALERRVTGLTFNQIEKKTKEVW